MSGECDHCDEYTHECTCNKKTFEQLVADKAGCFEFAWNGHIRFYKEGEERCKCTDCIAMDKLNDHINRFFGRQNVTPPPGTVTNEKES